MSEEVSKILERNIKHLERRRSYLRELDKNIWPDNCQLLDVFEKMPLEKINKIILLPHPYPYDSGTGIPVMICNERKPTVSLNNILKAFSKARTDNFNELWEEGVILMNLSLTEEEEHPLKISHKTMWSRFIESLLGYVSRSSQKGLIFIFTGASGMEYKAFVDTTLGDNEILSISPITSKDFPEELLRVLERKDGK